MTKAVGMFTGAQLYIIHTRKFMFSLVISNTNTFFVLKIHNTYQRKNNKNYWCISVVPQKKKTFLTYNSYNLIIFLQNLNIFTKIMTVCHHDSRIHKLLLLKKCFRQKALKNMWFIDNFLRILWRDAVHVDKYLILIIVYSHLWLCNVCIFIFFHFEIIDLLTYGLDIFKIRHMFHSVAKIIWHF